MITLLLVEDEPLVRHGLRTWLERDAEIKVVGEASDGAEAIAQAQELQPDVVLMDIALPTMDGITAAAALRAAVPHSAVVFLSLYDDADTRARADAAGGAAFVGKHEGARALRSAIRQAGRAVSQDSTLSRCNGSGATGAGRGGKGVDALHSQPARAEDDEREVVGELVPPPQQFGLKLLFQIRSRLSERLDSRLPFDK